MNVDYFSTARKRRLIALASLERRQPELPGFGDPQAVVVPMTPNRNMPVRDWGSALPDDR